MINSPTLLTNLPKEVKLLPVIGAGVSMSLKSHAGQPLFPSWTAVLQRAADELLKIGKVKPSGAICSMIEYEMYQEAADIAKKAFVGKSWGDFLNSVFDIAPNEIDPDTKALPEAIWGVSRRVITLNFDKVLRYTCPSPSVTAFDNENRTALADFVRGSDGKDFIWHLHGTIDNISSLIFTSSGYEELYEEDKNFKAAIAALRTVSATERLLFVGCSLSDAELIAKIAEVAQVFDDHVGPHYALVHKSEAAAVEKRLEALPFEIVSFEEFGAPLIEIIKSLERVGTRGDVKPLQKKISQIKARAAVLICDALDHRYLNSDLIKELKKLKFETHFLSLNLHNLNSLNDFSYIFILSSVQRGKIVVEDEWLSANRIGIDELVESIDDANVKGVIVLLDNLDLDAAALARVSKTRMPITLSPALSKSQCVSLGFKLFKRSDPKLCDESIVFNGSSFIFGPMGEVSTEVKYKTPLPDSIDPRSLKTFIGRTEDLKSLCKRILENRDSGDVLTLKGAGGIGKTTLVKKAAVEFANRGVFSAGIDFIDCEFIRDPGAFQQQIGRVFDLQQADDFRSKMREHHAREDRLVILDNAENLLALADEESFTELVHFVSDYCTVVVTSRELLKLDNEIVFELRQLTTDEAVELFVKGLSLTDLDPKTLLFVRERIVEDLLDNNPLAIRLVTSSTPKGKDFKVLHAELESDVFSRIRDDEAAIFTGAPDRNVERKSSLYASINYSYGRLSEREKNAFEVLSLFPDGINMESFKRISEQARSSKRRNIIDENNPAKQFLITDSLIKSLENKSIIEIDNETVSLQSLVGRFAENVFAKRSPSDIRRFRRSAFSYNESLAAALASFIRENELLANTVFWKYQKNFLKALSFSNSIGEIGDELIDYIANMALLCNRTCSYDAFLSAMRLANFSFGEAERNDYVAVECLVSRYFKGEFDAAFSQLQKKFDFDYIKSLSNTDPVQQNIAGSVLRIYLMEGFLLDVARLIPEHGGSFTAGADLLFQLGEFDTELIIKSAVGFTTFDAKYAINRLEVEELDLYIKRLHKQQHLERMQANYLRLKLTGSALDDVNSLVTVNPYTVGIKHLISAMTNNDYSKAEVEFEDAIKNLSHIKYYYVEAIFNYARMLSVGSNGVKFLDVVNKGVTLARDHGFRFLQHQLQQLIDQSNIPYSSALYPLPEDISRCLVSVAEREKARPPGRSTK
jgi:hypothetical protein